MVKTRQQWIHWREWSNMLNGGRWFPFIWFWDDEEGYIPP